MHVRAYNNERFSNLHTERYGLPEDQVRAYLHYKPSYYHLHVHFTHLKYEAPKTLIGQAHFLEEVIDNIEHIDPLYYQKRQLLS